MCSQNIRREIFEQEAETVFFRNLKRWLVLCRQYREIVDPSVFIRRRMNESSLFRLPVPGKRHDLEQNRQRERSGSQPIHRSLREPNSGGTRKVKPVLPWRSFFQEKVKKQEVRGTPNEEELRQIFGKPRGNERKDPKQDPPSAVSRIVQTANLKEKESGKEEKESPETQPAKQQFQSGNPRQIRIQTRLKKETSQCLQFITEDPLAEKLEQKNSRSPRPHAPSRRVSGKISKISQSGNPHLFLLNSLSPKFPADRTLPSGNGPEAGCCGTAIPRADHFQFAICSGVNAQE